MATVAAGPVFRPLGAKDLGVKDEYRTAKMPPVNTGLLDGHLAWRQNDGGHTDAPNWQHFLPGANRLLHNAPVSPPGPAQTLTGLVAYFAAPFPPSNSPRMSAPKSSPPARRSRSGTSSAKGTCASAPA